MRVYNPHRRLNGANQHTINDSFVNITSRRLCAMVGGVIDRFGHLTSLDCHATLQYTSQRHGTSTQSYKYQVTTPL